MKVERKEDAMIRLFSAVLICILVFSGVFTGVGYASEGANPDASTPTEAPDYGFTVEANGAILMEASTGTVLYEQNADAAYSPASVTKIMTLLLVMEAIECGKIALTDLVPVSEYAASMGGSQVFLEAGEEMSLVIHFYILQYPTLLSKILHL